MYKNKPWILDENGVGILKEQSTKKKCVLQLVREIFEGNQNKTYSMSDIGKEINKENSSVGGALISLRSSREIKVVGVRDIDGNVVFLYQHIKGKLKEVKLLDITDAEKSGITTLPAFMRKHKVKNEVGFKCIVKTLDLPKCVVKTKTNACYGYHTKDLRRALKEYEGPKKSISKKNKVKDINISLKLFGFKITIQKSSK